jgi:hypothetical protein
MCQYFYDRIEKEKKVVIVDFSDRTCDIVQDITVNSKENVTV